MEKREYVKMDKAEKIRLVEQGEKRIGSKYFLGFGCTEKVLKVKSSKVRKPKVISPNAQSAKSPEIVQSMVKLIVEKVELPSVSVNLFDLVLDDLSRKYTSI